MCRMSFWTLFVARDSVTWLKAQISPSRMAFLKLGPRHLEKVINFSREPFVG